jgi:hypothetical protein
MNNKILKRFVESQDFLELSDEDRLNVLCRYYEIEQYIPSDDVTTHKNNGNFYDVIRDENVDWNININEYESYVVFNSTCIEFN